LTFILTAELAKDYAEFTKALAQVKP
jgi:hypothetical protein